MELRVLAYIIRVVFHKCIENITTICNSYHLFSSGHEICHYDIKYLSEYECVFNKYTFPGILEVVEFYTENRLGGVFLEKPVSVCCLFVCLFVCYFLSELYNT